MPPKSRRQPKVAAQLAPRRSKPRPQGSFIRRRLVGPTPLERLAPEARQFVEEARALDELLLKRGWTFRPDTIPSCLEWTWPAAPDSAEAEIIDQKYRHELTTVTTVGYYFDRLEPMNVAVNMAGGCGWNGDLLIPQQQLIEDIEKYEAIWEPDRREHMCPLAGHVIAEIDPERAEQENLVGTGPLPFPVSLIDERCAQIAQAHPGAQAPMLRKAMELSPVLVYDRLGRQCVYVDVYFTAPFAAVIWAQETGRITWDEDTHAYHCSDPTTLWHDIEMQFEGMVESGLVSTVRDTPQP